MDGSCLRPRVTRPKANKFATDQLAGCGPDFTQDPTLLGEQLIFECALQLNNYANLGRLAQGAEL